MLCSPYEAPRQFFTNQTLKLLLDLMCEMFGLGTDWRSRVPRTFPQVRVRANSFAVVLDCWRWDRLGFGGKLWRGAQCPVRLICR